MSRHILCSPPLPPPPQSSGRGETLQSLWPRSLRGGVCPGSLAWKDSPPQTPCLIHTTRQGLLSCVRGWQGIPEGRARNLCRKKQTQARALCRPQLVAQLECRPTMPMWGAGSSTGHVHKPTDEYISGTRDWCFSFPSSLSMYTTKCQVHWGSFYFDSAFGTDSFLLLSCVEPEAEHSMWKPFNSIFQGFRWKMTIYIIHLPPRKFQP